MPTVLRPKVTEIRSALGGLLRNDLKAAAGDDKILQPAEAARVLGFTQRVANDLGAGDHSINQIMDSAMARASVAWGAVNQPTGSGKAWLSAAEIAALTAGDPDLGAVTGAAAALALRKKNPAPMNVALVDAPAGVSLTTSGVRVMTVSLAADATVPVGTTFGLNVDGNRIDIKRGPAGLEVFSLVPPQGYGLEVVARGPMTDPTSTAVLKISRDPATWLTHESLVMRARQGLEEHIKTTRMHDSDWTQYFPSTWAELVTRGVPAQLDAFFANPETEVTRKQGSTLFVGRGPFDLYTEIEVARADGAIKSALIEID